MHQNLKKDFNLCFLCENDPFVEAFMLSSAVKQPANKTIITHYLYYSWQSFNMAAR